MFPSAAARTLSAAVCIAVCLSITEGAYAQMRQWSLATASGERTLSAAAQAVDGVEYVSLNILIDQAGGVINVLPGRVRVDLLGTTSWLRANNTRVDALSIFSLQHPIREQNGGVYIAASDVPDYFLKSFRARVREVAAAPPQDSMEPLEELSPAPPPTVQVKPEDAPQAPERPETLSGTANIGLVLIDPGHGGLDPGFDAGNGAVEKSIALAVATKLAQRASKAEALRVAVTRQQDTELSMEQRAYALSQNPATLYVGLHAATSFSPRAHGITIVYPTQRDAATFAGATNRDAERVQNSRSIASAVASALTESTGQPIRGVVAAPIQPVYGSAAPGIVVELGYLTNSDDAALLTTEAYQDALAEGIWRGIENYLNRRAEDDSATPGGSAR